MSSGRKPPPVRQGVLPSLREVLRRWLGVEEVKGYAQPTIPIRNPPPPKAPPLPWEPPKFPMEKGKV